MLSWLKKLAPRPATSLPCSGVPDWKTLGITPEPNPGNGCCFSIAFRSERRSWEESLNMVELLAEVLGGAGLSLKSRADRIELRENGLCLRPQIVSFQPLEEGRGTQCCTTIEVSHPLFPAFFEYQHSTGETAREAIIGGFASWMSQDLPAIRDALREKPVTCTVMEIPFPDANSGKRWRRVVLGPVTHAQKPDSECAPAESDHHPGCPCCFFTHLGDVLKPLTESESFAALKLFAVRQKTGEIMADCRVNGQEFEPSKESLRHCARMWQGDHFEFRKQLIIIQNWFDCAG